MERIVPSVAVVRSSYNMNKQYLFHFQPDGLNLLHIQLPTAYPVLVALRRLPYNKDHHALTAAILHSIRMFLDTYLKGKYVLLLQVVYHKATPVKDSHRRQLYMHPDLCTGEKQIISIGELILEIIYTATETGVAEGLQSPSFRRVQDMIFKKLNEQHQLSCPPFWYSYLGNPLEIHSSLSEYINTPRRHHLARVVQCVTIYGIPEGCLAEDVLNCLATCADNYEALDLVMNAVVVPPVLKANPPLPWRIHLLGLTDKQLLDITPLQTDSTGTPNGRKIMIRQGAVPGFEPYDKLYAMYESYYARQDSNLHNNGKPEQCNKSPEPVSSSSNTNMNPPRPRSRTTVVSRSQPTQRQQTSDRSS